MTYRRRGEANSTASGRRVRQHRSFARWGKARPEKWRAAPRPEPDSGNPTVRDRRGASGNVASWRTLHAARAPDFYLDNRMHDSMGGGRKPASVGYAARCQAPPAYPTVLSTTRSPSARNRQDKSTCHAAAGGGSSILVNASPIRSRTTLALRWTCARMNPAAVSESPRSTARTISRCSSIVAVIRSGLVKS